MKPFFYIASFMCLLAITLFLFSCATLFKGTSENVDFSSDPSGAKVYVNGNLVGTAPVRLKLESKKTYSIEFKKEEYETQTFTITNSIGAGWIILDVLAGLVPVIVDVATGAWYSLDQTNINAILKTQQSPAR